MKRIGYGQVEPNHLSAQRTGQIYAQLPAAKSITQLENGQFAKYDYANGEVNLTAADKEWLLVFNEIKLYDGMRETYKDYVMSTADAVNGEIVPRLFKTNVGDIFTTNCLEKAGAKNTETTMTDLEVGNVLGINANGFLEKDATSSIKFQVVKVYTMADGQDAVKIQRIA